MTVRAAMGAVMKNKVFITPILVFINLFTINVMSNCAQQFPESIQTKPDAESFSFLHIWIFKV